MINLKLIYKVIGSLLFIEAALMAVCLAMAFCYREDDILAFGVAVTATVLCGMYMRFRGRGSDNSLSRRDAYLVVTLTWLVFSLLGTLPFVVSGYLPSFTDAFFETMSGFTTTGATMISDVEALPHGLLFWRSLMQWIGGLGIVFFTIALLPSLVGGSVKVFAAEATGPIKTKLHPRLSTGAKWLWVVFLVITLLCTLSLSLAGMDLFDSLNYGMTTAATGGFATLNCSGALSPAIQYILTFFCFVAGINFTLLYVSVSRLRLRMLFRSAEFRFYAALVAVCTLFIMVPLLVRGGYGWEHAFRSSVFQVVSFVTSTGFVSDDAALCP